ncbi:hypothetical protein BDY24DRAFT_383019 [Mrakia frigida]|uniref:uncharacterized protein n=1 Tax=Mrakia frigida TaxID=29902 RepID=UPI003FCC0AB6
MPSSLLLLLLLPARTLPHLLPAQGRLPSLLQPTSDQSGHSTILISSFTLILALSKRPTLRWILGFDSIKQVSRTSPLEIPRKRLISSSTKPASSSTPVLESRKDSIS